jgi:hypothetical protein
MIVAIRRLYMMYARTRTVFKQVLNQQSRRPRFRLPRAFNGRKYAFLVLTVRFLHQVSDCLSQMHTPALNAR